MTTVFFGVLIFIVCVAGVSFFGSGSSIYSFGRPFWKMSSTIGGYFGGTLDFFHSKSKLIAERDELLKKNNELESVARNAHVLQDENNFLREMLGRKSEDFDFVVASVLARPGFFSYDALIIDAGAGAGLSKGDLVYADPSTIIGYLSDVASATSHVTLFSNPDQKTDVLIGTATTTPTIAQGKGNGNFEIRLPRNISIKLGDPVRFAAYNHIVLGTISKILTNPADSFEKILFTLPVNTQELPLVLIQKHASPAH